LKDRCVPKAKRTSGGHATTELGGAYNARPSPNGHQAVELDHAGNTKPTQNGHQTTELGHPSNSKPIQDGRLATKLDSTYTRNVPTSVNTTSIAYQQSPETPAHFLPICKSSAHEPQDIMSDAEPKEIRHPAAELDHADNAQPTGNGHHATELDHPGNSKPIQDGPPTAELDSACTRNVPTSVNTSAIAYQKSPEDPAHLLPICKSSAHERQDIMSDAELKQNRHPAAELDHADNAQPTGNGHHATGLDHPGNSKPIRDGRPATKLDSTYTRNVPTSVNTTAIAYQKSPEAPAHLLPICKSSAHKRQDIMSGAELDAELASLRSGIEGLGRSYRTLSFILSSYEKEREMAGNKEIPSERREYIRRLLEYA